MPKFTRLEVWSDVACNSGTRLAAYPLGTLLSCQATFSLDGNEQLTFSVPARRIIASFEEVRLTEDDGTRITEDSGTRVTELVTLQGIELTRGLVVRVCTASATAFDEWRIRDVEQDAQAGITSVVCDSMGLDLARAVYTAYDSTGAPVSEFSAVEIDAEGLVDGPIRDALDDAGLAYIVKGTIQPTGTFNADADWASARTLALQAVERGGGELQVRRNGTTDYRIDMLEEIGSTAPIVYARTKRNLLTTQRRTIGALGGTRVTARGRDDSTSRTMAYAYWEVMSLVTGLAGSRTGVVIRDPRGTGFPPPYGTGADRCDGWYLSRLVPTYAGAEILASSAVSSTETRLDLLATDVATLGVTVGDYVELRLVNAVNGARPAALGDPTLAAAQSGIYDRIYDRTSLSGAVNYALNPFALDWSGQIDFRILGTATYSTGSATVTGVSSRYTLTVVPGDRLLRNSDNALIGTVLTVNSNTSITLAANALLTDTSVVIDVQKDAPTGVTYGGAGGTGALFTRVSSPVLGVSSDAINIVTDNADFGTLYIPLGGLRVSTNTPYSIWAWINTDLISPSGLCIVDLVRSDTLAVISSQTVQLTNADDGNLVRVLFQSPNISAATAGVSLAVRMTITHPMEVTIGPWGATPAGWAITDTATPGGCDLAHEAGLWLDTQSLPVSYTLDLVDIEQITGSAVSESAITLGGTIRIDDRDLGVVSDQRVVAFTRDYLRPGDVSLTLGRRDKTLAEYLSGTTGQSVSSLALALSRGLLTQAQRIDATPVLQATPTATTTIDTTEIRIVSAALRDSFVNL
jgi:hypothetical protein